CNVLPAIRGTALQRLQRTFANSRNRLAAAAIAPVNPAAAPRGRPARGSPASIASFLEAAGAAALELAGKILVRRS
ncbi:MAG TPA: hypothetical protein VGG06_23320, partial [Thermoanaerobaculia bacterium]